MADPWWTGHCREIADDVNFLAKNMPDDHQLTGHDVEHVLKVAQWKQHQLGYVTVHHKHVYLTIPSPKAIWRKLRRKAPVL